MRKNIVFLSTLLLGVLLLSSSVFAQEQFGAIEGTITDSAGAVVPNAAVTITGKTVGFNRSVTTNSDGFFVIRQVPPGSYNVTVAATAGFTAQSRDNVNVNLGVTTPSNFQLSVSGGTTTVNVTDELVTPVDSTESKVQTNVSAAKIELLPKGVDFTSILKTAPGTRGEGLAGGFQVDGASGSENSFVIDGQEVSNYRTGVLNSQNAIPTQFVAEVQIKSGGFEAEFGGATGGVINIVTKGGGNQFRGEFGAQFVTNQLNGAGRPSLARFASGTGATFVQPTEYIANPKAGGTNFFPTLSLSGPIFKNRLYFYGNYSPQIFSSDVTTNFYTNAPAATRTLTQSQKYKATNTNEYAFTRIDATPFDSLRVSGTYLWNPRVNDGVIPFGTVSLGGAPATVNFGGSVGTLSGPDLYSRQGGRANSNNVTAQANWTPSSDVSISGRFSRGFLNEKGANYFVPSTTRYVCQQGSTTIAGACPTGLVDAANTQTVRDVSVRTNFEFDGTYFFNGGGSHQLKGGYQRFRILNDVESGYVGPGRLDFYYGFTIADLTDGRVTATPGSVGAGELIRIGTKGRGQNTNQSIYVQDKWQIAKRLTLNVGVRFEKEDLPSFNSFAPPIKFGWGDKIVPRIGGSFDVFGNGKTKIYASYSEFNDRLKFELPRGSFGGDTYRVDYFEIFANSGPYRSFTPAGVLGNYNDAPGGRCPSTGFIGSGISRCQDDFRIASNNPNATIFDGKVDPDLKPFRQSEITAGFQHQLSDNYIFRSRYTHKNVEQAIEDAGVRNDQGSEAYIIGNPGQGLHLQLLKQLGYAKSAKPKRVYDGVEFTVERRLANNYYFNANYTYSRLFGNYSGLASSDENGRTSPGVNRFFDLPFIGFTAAGTPDDGRLATDRPHVFNAYGAYIFDWKGSKTNESTFSFFTSAQSGTPLSTTIAWETTTIFTKRGDLGRTETFTNTDFSFSHKYRFGRDNRLAAIFDFNVLNLFDEKNVTGKFVSKSAVTIGPANFGLTEVAGINAYTSGALLSQINAYLAGSATVLNRSDSRYNQANAFQGPRNVRFGFRLQF